MLVDGGIMNPIPVAEARALSPNCPVVAIVLSPPLGWQEKAENDNVENIPLLMTNLPLVYRLAGRLRLAQVFNIFTHSMDLSGLMLMDKQLKMEKPEVIIRPKLGAIGIIDRVDIPGVIKSGELAAEQALGEIRKTVSWQFRWRQRLSRFISL